MNETLPKPKKAKGPIRWEAVVPFLIVTVIVYLYFFLFFDTHLRKGLEWIGYEVVGAEVNISEFKTSFTSGTLQIKGIQITNPDQPKSNLIEIGDIRFGMLWDGLLRGKVVINEMAVEKIEIATSRKSPGKVKPPEPPPPVKEGPSKLEQEAQKLKDQALEKAQEKYSQNVLGDIAAMLGGSSAENQMGKLEDSLPSKAKLKELEASFKEKEKQWNSRIQSLPQGKEIQALGDRLGKVKTKDFKTPQELQQSLEQIKAIVDEADQKVKLVQQTGTDLNSEVKSLDLQIKELDAMVKKDIQDLQARFKLPQLDAKAMSMALFHRYLDPYLSKFNHYRNLAEKYLPPKLIQKKGAGGPEEIPVQPHVRAKGMVYEFGRPNSYPAFWIKKISISSKAGSSANAGDVAGLISNITSNQTLIQKPTSIDIKGDFPGMAIRGLTANIFIDSRKEDSKIGFDFKVGSYPLAEKSLIDSSDVQIGFAKAQGKMSTTGELIGLKNLSFKIDNQFNNVDYNIAAKNEILGSIIKNVFAGISVVTLDAVGSAQLPGGVSLDINSNLGAELQKGFEAQIRKKIDEAKAKLQAYIDDQVGKEKAKFEGEVNKLKSQLDSEVKKVQEMLNKEKAKGEQQVTQAKKDAENQAKKQVEDQVKKSLGSDAEKKIEDLKKKFGL